jgi:hypothetical protein
MSNTSMTEVGTFDMWNFVILRSRNRDPKFLRLFTLIVLLGLGSKRVKTLQYFIHFYILFYFAWNYVLQLVIESIKIER